MDAWAVIVAAGGGTRFGGAKQFAMLAGTSVLDRSVATAVGACAGVVVVLPHDGDWTPPAGVVTVVGGATRSESVRAGLAAVPAAVEIVAVHDAARPLASPGLWAAVITAVRSGADAAVPGLAVADTVKRVRAGSIVETVRRDDLVLVQTPQAFRANVLRDAHATGGIGTDDAALVEAAGGTVVVVAGEVANRKITEPDDLVFAEAMLSTTRS
ncbi:MAG: 2-C-methyl-D-erythritol 4-phosphate cytidylyltransferase [Actinomycetota bacterium]